MIDWSKQLTVRFGLRHILIAFVFVAVGCTLLFAAPSVVAIPWLIVITIAFPAALTAGIVYSRGGVRAFCIGGFFPAVMNLLAMSWLLGFLLFQRFDRGGSSDFILYLDRFGDRLDPELRFFSALSWFLTIAAGWLVMFIRWINEQESDVP